MLCDNFFQGAFGGSFLNHQYLINATAPFYPNAAQSVAKALTSPEVKEFIAKKYDGAVFPAF